MCVWLWVYYHVYLSPVCWVPCRLVYLLFPVFLCVYLALSYLDVVIKDYYFEVSPRLRVPRSSLLCAPWQKTRPNSKRRPFTSFCFVRFFKFFWLFLCFVPAAALMPAVRGSLRRRSRLSHPAVRGSSREFTPPFAAQPSRRSREFTPPFAAQRFRRSREFTPPFADQPAHRSQEMTPPSTANPSPPARHWINARRPASDSMPAGLPLTQARRIAADSSSPDCRWLMPAGRRPWGKPTHRRRLPLVRGEGQPAVRGHSARHRLWLPPARRSPPLSGQASRLWSRQPSVAVFDQTVTKVFLSHVFKCVSSRRAPDTPELPHGFFLGGYKGPGCRGRAEGRGHGHHGPPALASWAPCSTLASVCLFRSGGPVLCMSLCLSCGVSRVPTPPPW